MGRVCTRYTTLPVPTWAAPRLLHVRLTAVPLPGRVTTGTCTYDRFRASQGDPRGVKRTPVPRTRSNHRTPALTPGPAVPLGRLGGDWLRAVVRASKEQSLDSQYISVFLSISQYSTDLSTTQYFSVFLSISQLVLEAAYREGPL